ncbi:MAG: hypothetical protein PHR45_05770 [Muribaculaceae bacterium]|nr:hypothetical protein [Muribaculaceae bacterium]
MKQIGIISACICAITISLFSCNNGKLKEAQTENQELTDSLTTALAAQDSLMALLNEISDGMTQINDMEQIISTTNLNKESVDQKEEIKNNMVLIAQTLKSRRDRLNELEKKLKNSGAYTSKIQKTIESLKAQIETQEASIGKLQEELKNANIKIEGLTNEVSTLNTTVETVSSEKAAAQEEATRVANELNTCFYVIGSNKELKANKIIEKKFLGKTKVLEGDFERSYFTKADKRSLNELALHSKKAKLLSKHPAGSYEIIDNSGAKSLKITNPTKFWELSNYLIIEID